MIFAKDNTPRWIIVSIDTGICLFSILLAYLVRFNFSIPQQYIETFGYIFPLMVSLRLISFFLFGTYKGIIRYTSSVDTQRIFVVVSIVSLLFVLINTVRYLFIDGSFVIPFSVIIIDYMATIFLMISFRITVKLIYFEFKTASKEKIRVVIFGAGEAGIITKRTLGRDQDTKYQVVAFIDHKNSIQGKKIEGVKILSPDRLEEILEKHEIDQVILSVQNISKAVKQEIVETSLPFKVKVLHLPPVKSWVKGELSPAQLQQVKIEDLLGREPIHLDTVNIKSQLTQKRVLVTGAAGSIGSEIVRQVADYYPSNLILLDQAESPLYEIELEIKEKYGDNYCEAVIADVSNLARMKNVFQTFKPEVVYHAAAYKHVPLMEDNPSEATLTNIGGSKNLIDLADEYGVESFVMISTDKAVNPTNVMGASKRVAEIYAQSKNSISNTNYITTRFGNVLGSNGSVIPLFRRQIKNGGPVTVTHPEITRYFMTIPEACQLVLEAGAMGKGGEIYIFDMGKPIKIIDLAKKMIKLSGLELGKDIDIKMSGLRAGEKLYEELLNNKENTLATHHPQIMIAKVEAKKMEEIIDVINDLISSPSDTDNFNLVKGIKVLVPEFKSQNSIFTQLD
ncbi:MAG: polysaccharide biosynthesis protein [Crocinitomicaceae bacterium]|nr:polysaccharide biosynthesis protein [Crocinitomicaceae bacterium]|tara:strand:- start:483 stop:2348 length:1866 start_codon:yes stop_codon:yes gene_type:complete